MTLNHIKKRFGALVCTTLLSGFAATVFAQSAADADFDFTFDNEESVASWELLYTGGLATTANLGYEDGSLAFYPEWQAGDDFFGYGTSLGGVYDFTNATIYADVLYSSAYSWVDGDGFMQYLVGGAVILVDTEGRVASTQFRGPWMADPDTFAQLEFLRGERDLDYIEEGFDLTQISSVGVNIHALGDIPDVTGAIRYDNLLIDLDGAANDVVDDRLFLKTQGLGWGTNSLTGSTAYTEERSNHLKLQYDQTIIAGLEYISYDFPWKMDLVNSRMSFDIQLPVEFEQYITSMDVRLYDGAGRVASLDNIRRRDLVFGQPIYFDYKYMRRQSFVSADENFNLNRVSRFEIVFDFGGREFIVSNQLDLLNYRLLLDGRKARNYVNSTPPPKLTIWDMFRASYLDEWFDGYQEMHDIEWRENAFVLIPNWQEQELALGVGTFQERPFNLGGKTITQRVYIPSQAIGTGMELEVVVRDIWWNQKKLLVSVLDDSAQEGWMDIAISASELGSIETNVITEVSTTLYRNNALGAVGAFRFAPYKFQ